MRPEGLGQWKIPMTPPGIEPEEIKEVTSLYLRDALAKF